MRVPPPATCLPAACLHRHAPFWVATLLLHCLPLPASFCLHLGCCLPADHLRRLHTATMPPAPPVCLWFMLNTTALRHRFLSVPPHTACRAILPGGCLPLPTPSRLRDAVHLAAVLTRDTRLPPYGLRRRGCAGTSLTPAVRCGHRCIPGMPAPLLHSAATRCAPPAPDIYLAAMPRLAGHLPPSCPHAACLHLAACCAMPVCWMPFRLPLACLFARLVLPACRHASRLYRLPLPLYTAVSVCWNFAHCLPATAFLRHCCHLPCLCPPPATRSFWRFSAAVYLRPHAYAFTCLPAAPPATTLWFALPAWVPGLPNATDCGCISRLPATACLCVRREQAWDAAACLPAYWDTSLGLPPACRHLLAAACRLPLL